VRWRTRSDIENHMAPQAINLCYPQTHIDIILKRDLPQYYQLLSSTYRPPHASSRIFDRKKFSDPRQDRDLRRISRYRSPRRNSSARYMFVAVSQTNAFRFRLPSVKKRMSRRGGRGEHASRLRNRAGHRRAQVKWQIGVSEPSIYVSVQIRAIMHYLTSWAESFIAGFDRPQSH
jgi:hypothetical protein